MAGEFKVRKHVARDHIMYDYNDNIKETNSFVSQRKTKMFSFKVLHE